MSTSVARRERKAGEAEELRRGIKRVIEKRSDSHVNLIRDGFGDDDLFVPIEPLEELLEEVDARAALSILEELDAARKRAERLFKENDALRRAAVVRDNGYRRCLLCKAQGHMGQVLRHGPSCPIGPRENGAKTPKKRRAKS